MSVFGLQIQYGIGEYGADGEGEVSLQRFSVALERLGEDIADFGKHVFPRVIDLFEKTIDGQFQAQGRGPVVGPWAPLSPKYAAWKEANFPGLPILQRTGELKNALTKDGNHALRDYSGVQLNFGTFGIEYASFHQTGTPRLSVRAMFDFDSEFEGQLTKQMQLGVIEAAREVELEVTE